MSLSSDNFCHGVWLVPISMRVKYRNHWCFVVSESNYSGSVRSSRKLGIFFLVNPSRVNFDLAFWVRVIVERKHHTPEPTPSIPESWIIHHREQKETGTHKTREKTPSTSPVIQQRLSPPLHCTVWNKVYIGISNCTPSYLTNSHKFSDLDPARFTILKSCVVELSVYGCVGHLK